MTNRRLLGILPLLLLGSTGAEAISLGILDDFEAGPMSCTTDSWTEGVVSPTPPVALLGCGESGSCCLQNDSLGGFGSGSRQTTFNEDQWTGDYIAAGVNKIELLAANPSETEPLYLRIGVTNGQTCFVSSDPVLILPGNPLRLFGFYLDQATMTEVAGTSCFAGGDDLDVVLSNVTQLRIVSAQSPAWSGDVVLSTVQFDAIQAKRDSDLDEINDEIDNCTNLPNPDQFDSNGDGYGNACDADINNDCVVDLLDLALFRNAFLTSPISPNWNPDSDFNNDQSVNLPDLTIMRRDFLAQPGPGLGSCDCPAPSPLGSNADFSGLPMFMRGGLIFDWGAVPQINEFSDQTGGLYVARFEVNPGLYEWKIADADWSIEYCTATTLLENTTTNAPLFGCTFPQNGTIDIPTFGCHDFIMQTDGLVPPGSVDITFRNRGSRAHPVSRQTR